MITFVACLKDVIMVFRPAFVFYCLICLTFSLSAQRRVTTISGQKVVILQNGGWKYTTENNTITDTLNTQVHITPDTNPPVMEDSTDIGIELLLRKARLKEIESLILLDDLDKATASKEVLLSQARQVKNKETIATLKAEVADLRNKLNTADNIYKHAGNLVMQCLDLNKMANKEKSAKMKELGLLLNVNIVPYLPKENIPSDTMVPMDDVVMNPSPPTKGKPAIKQKRRDDCNLIRIEKVKNGYSAETAPYYFFSFTPDRIKSYFKDKDLMNVKVALSKDGKVKTLKLFIKLFSKDAARNYGYIEKGSMLRLNFINGKFITLYAAEHTSGITETYTGHINYEAAYIIKGDDIDMLYEVPLDKAGIMWSSGFESYDVYHVDVFMKLGACLKKNSK